MLPGIGDIYWIAVALPALLESLGYPPGTIPELVVWDFDGRRRGGEYIDRLPFARNGGYFVQSHHPSKMPEFRQSYLTGERSLFPGFLGFDFYVAVNGALRVGRTVEDALGVACDWHFPMRVTAAEEHARTRLGRQFGRYLVLHFSEFGMFKPWVDAWKAEGCADFIRAVHAETGLTPLLTGCAWDRPFSATVARLAGAVDLAGETDPDTFFGLLRGASGVAGWCGGNTIKATYYRIPTLIGWSRATFPDPRFFVHSCPPDAGAWYRPVTVEETSPLEAADLFLELLLGQPQLAASA